MSSICEQLHEFAASLKRHTFPFAAEEIPENGIYLLFEVGEHGHGGNRIVRAGTHTGEKQLRSRLKQHFINPSKDRSIFRKNIGRALLSRDRDPFLEKWELDLTTKKAKDKHGLDIDIERQKEIESEVTAKIQKTFSFVVLPVDGKGDRLEIESKVISTVSLCEACRPSGQWLGNTSPKSKIRESGLWLVNELYKEPLSADGLDALRRLLA